MGLPAAISALFVLISSWTFPTRPYEKLELFCPYEALCFEADNLPDSF